VLRARTVGTPLEAVLAQPGQFRHSSLTLTTVYTGPDRSALIAPSRAGSAAEELLD
jgi:hypothetical protein